MERRPSIAEALFEQIVAHVGYESSVELVRAMVKSTPPTVESEYLEFKGASEEGKPLKEGDIKKIWSEALAGFGTTSGGVLIWGIDARKVDQIDQASGFNLVDCPAKLRDRLSQLQNQSTDPPVLGVKIVALPDPNEDGKGFVVCFIPESEYKPHRTESGGKRWVIRAGDSFIDAPTSVLRSLFFPRRQSYATIQCRIETKTDLNVNLGRYVSRSAFSFFIKNEGPSTIDDLMLWLNRNSEFSIQSGDGWSFARVDDSWRLQYSKPIHPGDIVAICRLSTGWDVATENQKAVAAPRDVEFGFRVLSTDQMPQECRIQLSAEQVKKESMIEKRPVPLAEN